MGGVGDPFHDGIDIVEGLTVREAKDHVVKPLEVGVSGLIVRALLLSLMHLSVKLDDHPPITAAEVRNERTNRVLA
jgi:hypothetical protein